MNAQAKSRVNVSSQGGISTALLFSMLLHAFILIVGTLGLPYIAKPLEDNAPPIPIEMVDISDITQTTKPAERAIPKPEEEKKEPPKPEPERPKQAPKQTAATPPKPAPASKDDLVLPDKKAEKVKPEKVKEKPPVPKKSPVLTQDTNTPAEDDPFKALLKNLQDEKPDPSTEQGKAVAKPEQATPAPLGETMTMSELDALRQQLSQCWNVLAGARYAEDLVVDMKLYMNPDRTVRQASVVDSLRYTTDNVFRAAADSAMRAVRDPQCSPLRLPPDKYNQWKEITIRFDPREIL